MRVVPSLAVLLAAGAFAAACSGAERDAERRAAPSPPPTRLYLAGDGQLTVIDVDTERARVVELPQLSPGDPPYRIVRRGRSLVFYGGDTYAVDLEVGLPPRKVHESWFFIPSAVEDRIWVALLDPDSPETERALSGVAEITNEGAVTVGPAQPPGGRWPVAAVTDGLLFERDGGGLELWDPATEQVIQRIPEASAGPTHRNLLAWCDADFRLHLTDVTTARTVVVVAPPAAFGYFACWAGAFAPDGKMLAVPLSECTDFVGLHTLALVDVPSGRLTIVTESEVPSGYVFVAWDSPGEQVFLTGGESWEPRTIVAYRVGDDRARKLDVRVPDFYGVAAS